jgi:gliding motility-associated-like protein
MQKKTSIRKFLFTILGILQVCLAFAQPPLNPYTINGSAFQETCNCYTLTPNAGAQSGSVWNRNKINLNVSFEFSFNVFLGCTDVNGADGLAFVLQPISTSLGTLGGGLGFQGITPSVAISIDTWQNGDNNDPTFDHISIQANGDLNHNSVNNLAGPVTALRSSDNIEDCILHTLKIKWDAVTKTLTASVDGDERVTINKDIVADIFSGNAEVFWGFTASTGGAQNLQRFCTSLSPRFNLGVAGNQSTCVGQPITFLDASTSFGSIISWFWDFGDGTTSTLANPPPHIYTTANVYQVKLVIVGNDGCVSDTFRQEITVGTFPVADFDAADVCEGNPVNFTDRSSVLVGSINSWNWDFGNGNTAIVQNPSQNFATTGPQTVTLRVRTVEGCASPPVQKTVNVRPLSGAAALFRDTCISEAVTFSGVNTRPLVPIQSWTWVLGDGFTSNSQQFTHRFAQPGTYSVKLKINPVNGCPLDTIFDSITIGGIPAVGFSAADVCDGKPVIFSDSTTVQTGTITNWDWDFGNGNTSNLQNPTETYTSPGPKLVNLRVRTNYGCVAALQKPVTVLPQAKVEADFADDCAGKQLLFTGINLDPGVPIQNWKWVLGDGFTSSSQQFNHAYTRGGTYTVQLVAVPAFGCAADTIRRPIRIIETRAFAGNDTIVATGQPIQLNATGGGTIYEWTPPDNLSNPDISNPIAILQEDQTYTVKVSTTEGCATTDQVKIRVYKGPDIYVPTGFTPNNDNRNNILTPISVGIKEFNYFKVFNRWGQLIFSTNKINTGWDGRFGGIPQPSSTYIWMVQGKDYLGRVITKKGTVVLVR